MVGLKVDEKEILKVGMRVANLAVKLVEKKVESMDEQKV
jgi:hypothetical protein